jgi:hypothetical protein
MALKFLIPTQQKSQTHKARHTAQNERYTACGTGLVLQPYCSRTAARGVPTVNGSNGSTVNVSTGQRSIFQLVNSTVNYFHRRARRTTRVFFVRIESNLMYFLTMCRVGFSFYQILPRYKHRKSTSRSYIGYYNEITILLYSTIKIFIFMHDIRSGRPRLR